MTMKQIGDERKVSGFVNKNNHLTREGGMCNDKRSWAKLVLSLVCLGTLAVALPVRAQQNPSVCVFSVATVGLGPFCNSNATSSLLGQQVVVGQTIYYQASVSQSLDINCGFEGGQILITLPNGTVTNVTPDGGIPLVCGSPGCSPAGVPFVLSKVVPYTVRAVDIGVNQGGFSPCPATNVQATVTYTGGTSHCDAGNTCDPSASTSVCNPARIIGFVVEKAVACSTNNNCASPSPGSYSSTASGAKIGATDPTFCYRLIYRNTGTAGLNVTSVVDNVLGTLTAPGGIAPGGVVTNFTGPVAHATTQNNTVTALAAQTAQACFTTNIARQASATATVVPSDISCNVVFQRPAGTPLTSNSACDPHASGCSGGDIQIAPGGGTVTVAVRINNNGNQSIQNGQVKIGGTTVNVPGPIAAGGSLTVAVTTDAASDIGCHAFTADVVFQGTDTDGCPPIPTSCSSQFEVCGIPCVRIVKLVKCLELDECLGGQCSSNTGLYSPTATGVKDAGFCYTITITNCGTVPLTNVVVTDNQLGGSLGFSATLGVGASETRFFQKSYPGLVGDIRNTATVSGQSVAGNVSATTNALVHLLNPSITCTKQVSVDGGAFTSGGNVEVPFDSTHELTFRVIVRNNGSVDLQNVKVIDTGTSGCPVSTNIIASLPVGASVTNVLCTITEVTCPPTVTLSNIVHVCGEVSTNVCSIDPANCQRISVCSDCNNTITLTCVPPGACRTTGGGKQPQDDTCPEVRYVTHGGQVGASFGVAGAPDCATDTGFNNPCIRGEYQHVRHIKGGLRGTFHAAGNGNEHDFDSLMCACLPCDHTDTPSPFGGCHPADRCYDSENPTSPGKKHALCNPGDRICGPEPRRAPANKICFSGVGNYTMSNGKKTPQSVVFRVDLEDRSEPGGAFPKGAKAPPDRYRMRMWFIAAGSADTAAVKALRATVACKDATCEIIPATLDCVGGATPAPDIDDGGDLDRGNRQIHPSTGASCQ
jgi:hypothetical protein